MLTVKLKKIIKSLHQKKFQQKYNKFIVETPKVVSELAKSNTFKIDNICATPQWIQEYPVLAVQFANEIIVVNEKDLQQMSQLKTANAVLAIVNKPIEKDQKILGDSWSIFLDDVKDPGNIGTIIRTAEWFGIDQIIFSPQSVDPFSSKIIQASMGSYFRAKIYVKEFNELSQSDLAIYALHMKGVNLFQTIDILPGVIVVGSESRGVAPRILESATEILSIPTSGEAESLNAAMACGIAISVLTKK